MATTDYKSVDEYLAAQPTPTRSVLARVRETIRKALPNATEKISYQMPVYKVDGVMVLYFSGYKQHYAIYPASPQLLSALGNEVADRLHAKATLRFTYDEAVPTQLITRIAKLRAAEVIAESAEKEATKATPKKTPKAAPKKTVAASKQTKPAARSKLAKSSTTKS